MYALCVKKQLLFIGGKKTLSRSIKHYDERRRCYKNRIGREEIVVFVRTRRYTRCSGVLSRPSPVPCQQPRFFSEVLELFFVLTKPSVIRLLRKRTDGRTDAFVWAVLKFIRGEQTRPARGDVNRRRNRIKNNKNNKNRPVVDRP